MQITFSAKEVSALKALVCGIDENAVEEINKTMTESNVVMNYDVSNYDKSVYISVNSDFISEIIEQFASMTAVVVPMLKGMYAMGQKFGLSLMQVVEKYRKPAKKSECDGLKDRMSIKDISKRMEDIRKTKENFEEACYEEVIDKYIQKDTEFMSLRDFDRIAAIYGASVAKAVSNYMDRKHIEKMAKRK